MRGLYAIIDTSSLAARGLDPIPFAEAVLSTRPAALQLRDKSGASRDTLALLMDLAPRCQRGQVPLFCNDRADLALLAGCEGVHVGQRDVPPLAVQRLVQRQRAELVVGMSAHNADELAVALAQPIDYVAFGPVFATASKKNPDPTLGLEGLDALLAELRRRDDARPTVAIGGIDVTNASQVAARCDAIAVIGGLLPPPGDATPYETVAKRATQLHQLATSTQRATEPT